MRRSESTFNNVLLFSLLATGALHGGIEAFTEHGHGPRITVSETEHTIATDYSTQKQIGAPGMVDHTTFTPGETKMETVSSTTFVDGRYAKQFAIDPNASFVKDDVATSVAADIAKGKAAGLQNIMMYVDGLTSGEDLSQDSNAGLQLPSKENTELAAVRRQALIQFLVSKGLSADVAIVSGELVEDNLDDARMYSVQNAAKNEGYGNVLDLVNAWNDGKTFSSATNELLTKEINDRRGEHVRIVGQQIIPGTATSTHEQKQVCIVPTSTIITEHISTKPWKATLPYGVLLPLGALMVGSALETSKQLRQNKRRQATTGTAAMEVNHAAFMDDVAHGSTYDPSGDKGYSYAPPKGSQTYLSSKQIGSINGAGGIKPPVTERPIPTPLIKQERKDRNAATVQRRKELKTISRDLKAQLQTHEKGLDAPEGPPSPKRRRRVGALPWKLILPPLIAVPLLAAGLKACGYDNPGDKPQPPAPNPCAGLESVERPTGNVTHVKIIDGRETAKY